MLDSKGASTATATKLTWVEGADKPTEKVEVHGTGRVEEHEQSAGTLEEANNRDR